MDRRQFLLKTSALSGFLVVAQFPGMSLIARADDSKMKGQANGGADPAQKKFFVLIRAQFGWDVTLGLDPQIMPAGCDANDMFIEYRPEEIFNKNSLRLGPAASPMQPYADQIAVINGVFMSDTNVDHVRNLAYATCGTTNDGAGSLAVNIATHSVMGRFGVLFDNSLNLGTAAVMTTTFDNLQSLAGGANINSIASFLNQISDGSAWSRAQLTYMQGNPEVEALKKILDAHQQQTQNQSGSGSDPDLQYANYGFLAASGFASGCANQAQITISKNLDTHSDHPVNHLKTQKSVWAEIANICETFKKMPLGNDGASVFDQTTFMVVSEFSRTPALDASKGKDHNPFTNSVMLLGNGVRGGQSVGQSHLIARNRTSNGVPRHVAMLYSHESGLTAHSKTEASQGAFDFIRPENVAATVKTILGATTAGENLQQPLTRIIKNV